MLCENDFLDNICLLTHCYTDMQAINKRLASTAATLDLQVSTKKAKHMRINQHSDAPIILHRKKVEVTKFM